MKYKFNYGNKFDIYFQQIIAKLVIIIMIMIIINDNDNLTEILFFFFILFVAKMGHIFLISYFQSFFCIYSNL